MTTSAWVSMLCLLGMAMFATALAVDRNRLRQRAGNAEARLARQVLELGAARDRVIELTGYLRRSSSWDVDAGLSTEFSALVRSSWAGVDATSGAPRPLKPEHLRQ